MIRSWAAAAAILGVATFAILVGFSLLPDVRAGYPNGDFAVALNLFQHATSMTQLDALFGVPADPRELRAMTSGNTLDLFGFIPTYGLFMIAGAAMLGGGLRKGWTWIALTPALVAIGGDILETWSQLCMTTDWPHAAAFLPGVAPGCWIKFFFIALNALGCSAIALFGPRRRPILGVLGLPPVLVVGADWFHLLPAPALMTAAFGVWWVALLLAAAMETFRAKDASP